MTDRELQELCKESRFDVAFEEVVRMYHQRLYWHIRKMVFDHEDANDVLQNTLIKAWTGFPLFRWEAQLYTWLYRIATNEVLSFLKKRKFSAEEVVEQACNSESALFDGDHIQMALQKAIARLPDKQRLVFNMRYFDDIKYEDMSEMLGTSVGALKASYHHAAQKVETSMKEMLL